MYSTLPDAVATAAADAESLRSAGHELIDRMADYLG
ncbi:hypothetical protein FHS01_003208 [Longimicrobium terrae]|uniref:Uncharacterized protein n=1 Tax=Longimicrobium terrae TaxID=1639882 RepID=A0A841H0S5_9BACT|nr:hypothetical protein [Longimicrobium terrae]MBB6071556.1 hypothetical protein [Longimicrobium terrae]